MFRYSFFRRRVLADSLPKFSHDLVNLVAGYESEQPKFLTDETAEEKRRQAEDQKRLTYAKSFVSARSENLNYELALIAAEQGLTNTLSFLIFSKLVNPNRYPYPVRYLTKTTLLLEACRSPQSTAETRSLLIKVSKSHIINRVRESSDPIFGQHGGPTCLEGCAIENTLQNRDIESTSLLFKKKARFFSFLTDWQTSSEWHSDYRYLPMDYQTLSFIFSHASWFQIDRILNPRLVDTERQKYIRDCHARFLKENELAKMLAKKTKPPLKDLLRNEPLKGGFRKRFAEILNAVDRCFSSELLYLLLQSQIAVFENTCIDVKLLTAMSILDKYWIDPAKIANRDRAKSHIIRLNAILDTITKEFLEHAPSVLYSPRITGL